MKLVDGQYHIGLKCWRVLSDDETRAYSLNMPADANPDNVLAEAQRLDDMATAPIEEPVVSTPEDTLNAAIDEYIAATGETPETVADMVVARMDPGQAETYLDAKSIVIRIKPDPIETPIEKVG